MKKQLIIKDSQTAMEISPKILSETEFYIEYSNSRKLYKDYLESRREAESSLKEYTIEGIDIISEGKKRTIPFIYNNGNMSEVFPIGSTHTFEVNEEAKTAIVL